MSRILTALVMGLVVAFPAAGQEKEQPPDRPAIPAEKIDPGTDRSLTGFIEKIDARDGKRGTFVLRTTRDMPRYTLQVDGLTKILTNKNEPVPTGLRSPLLPRAEVRVVFIDRTPKEKGGEAIVHQCRVLQIIHPGK
jgi:hypothetical protein